jgi:hypothetical protein
VEAESRHRIGVLNEEGEQDADDPLKGDMRAVQRLFVKAFDKAPEDMPFMIFIDRKRRLVILRLARSRIAPRSCARSTRCSSIPRGN